MVNGKTAGKRAHQPTAYDPSMKVEMSCPTRKKWKPAESRTSRKPPPLAAWPALSGDAAAAPIHFYIVSKGRPDNVRAMHRMLAAGAREGDAPANVTWVVSTEEEVQAYREGGATRVLVGEGLCASRNRAIEDAAGAWCVQLSDDISGVSLCPDGRVVQDKTDAKEANRRIRDEAKPVHVSPEYAARRVVQRMLETQTWLGGLYVNTNVARSLFQPPTSPYHFIVGDFIVVRPGSAPRFDTNMRLKEDYDFTAQHLDVYGAVCRMKPAVRLRQALRQPGWRRGLPHGRPRGGDGRISEAQVGAEGLPAPLPKHAAPERGRAVPEGAREGGLAPEACGADTSCIVRGSLCHCEPVRALVLHYRASSKLHDSRTCSLLTPR